MTAVLLRFMQAPPPKTFTVHEEEDGWDTIQDAQNAVALFALFSVCCLALLEKPATAHLAMAVTSRLPAVMLG